MTGNFFPATTRKDLFASLVITLCLSIVLFIPKLLSYPGYFTETNGGLVLFLFFGLGALALYWNFPYETRANLSETITIPSKLLLALFGGFIGAWLSRFVLNYDPYAARIAIALFASLIEFVAIFCVPYYITLMLYFLLKRKKPALPIGENDNGFLPYPINES